jgi:abequosyltransferase
MNGIQLSVCMPTYNFGAFIGDTLASIVPQLMPGVEIVILDGGSTDNTAEIVRPFLNGRLPIRYVRQEARGGIDRDMARSVDLADGKYCWLFSSDDIMRPGAIARVLDEVHSDFDVYLCGLTLCDRKMNVIAEHEVLRARLGSVFELSNERDRLRYFALAATTTALFSFMGSLIIKRERWVKVGLDERYVGSCWAHVVRILRMIPTGLAIKYLGESLLLKRGGNDSFMDKGLVHRYAIAIEGYHQIARDVFGEDSVEAHHVRRLIVNEYPANALLLAKAICLQSNLAADVTVLDRLARMAYRDAGLRNAFHLALYCTVPVPAYMFARRVYGRITRRPRIFE